MSTWSGSQYGVGTGLLQPIVRNVRIVTPPAYEPVALADAKRWCNVDDDIVNEDGLIQLVIAAARERAEFLTGRAFIQRDAELLMDGLPVDGCAINLPLAPLQSVSYIRYTDSAGDEQELSGSPNAFLYDPYSTPGRLSMPSGTAWPGTNGSLSNVRIGFRCGYAPGGSPDGDADAYRYNVPALVKLWMQQRVVTYYDNRAAIDLNNITDLPRDFVDGLLDGLRVDFGFA